MPDIKYVGASMTLALTDGQNEAVDTYISELCYAVCVAPAVRVFTQSVRQLTAFTIDTLTARNTKHITRVSV